MAKTVVILGAGWAGLPLAHKLLKYTLPKAKDGLKVILVSPNSHFYWNIAAVRGVIPGAIPDEKLLLPIQPEFAQYSADNFEFVLGKAESIEPENNIVTVSTNGGSNISITYDHLVIATGSQIRSNLPFKPVGTHDDTVTALHDLQEKIGAAESIVVAGGGATSVETAGELAARYGSEKDITLVIGREHALQASNVLPSVSQSVEQDLTRLGVKLIRNAQVKEAETNSKEAEGPKTVLTLTNGSVLKADLYLPLFGVRVNTIFVPKPFLDATDNLVLEKTMRVAGTKNIWGIGDVGNLEVKQVIVVDAQIIYLSGALHSALIDEGNEIKDYTPSTKNMIFITMGKKYAAAQIGGWRVWGWLTAYMKGRYLFVDTAEDYVNGKRLRHASM